MAPNQKTFDQTYGLACQDSSAGWQSSAQVFSVPGTSWHFLMLKVRLMDDGKSVRLWMQKMGPIGWIRKNKTPKQNAQLLPRFVV
jgi:hypothetical protein